jgi:hypothetical protein
MFFYQRLSDSLGMMNELKTVPPFAAQRAFAARVGALREYSNHSLVFDFYDNTATTTTKRARGQHVHRGISSNSSEAGSIRRRVYNSRRCESCTLSYARRAFVEV